MEGLILLPYAQDPGYVSTRLQCSEMYVHIIFGSSFQIQWDASVPHLLRRNVLPTSTSPPLTCTKSGLPFSLLIHAPVTEDLLSPASSPSLSKDLSQQ